MKLTADTFFVDQPTQEEGPDIEGLKVFVRQFVDDQIGLEWAKYEVYPQATKGFVTITINSEGSMSVEEWQDLGKELIEALDRKGFGKFEEDTVSIKHVALTTAGYYE